MNEDLIKDACFLFLVGVLACFGWVIFKFITATGSVEFCYIDVHDQYYSRSSYEVMGYRQWAGDVSLGHYNTNAEAVEAANKLQCLAKHK